ncbi:sensor histidine kinase [Abyssibacter profundi]|uniref:histidine kinase n=1 Tax=Abyssibacter profundi TaxID=2182787 RepID=A0A363UKT1_9GAMM|nr:ATP-binding protein [Abyssibacter profundi]PWN56035.1 hypothetical protein DEH80_09480 [Abyssibacter profundi]
MTDKKIRALIELELQKSDPDWALIENASRGQVDSNPSTVRFTVDAGHIQRLGAELVGKQDTALSELIKNAFDSDATSVTLDFKDQDQAGGSLTITDNGSGMSDDVIRSSWMRISTASKVDQPLSPIFRRVRAGRKGIGRFSVQRLGKRLRLETRPRGSRDGFRVFFNWDEEFQPGRDLHDVFNRIERFDKAPDHVGTTLEIEDLRDAWNDKAISRVWRSVLLLQPPFPISRRASDVVGRVQDPGFAVVINGTSRAEKSVQFSIDQSFLSQAIATITASVDGSGVATVRLVSSKLGVDDAQTFPEQYLLTGPVEFTTHYFIYSSSTLSGMTQSAAAEMGRTFGGIRIYRNGFRVLPYGQASDDWLQLDLDVSRRDLLVPANNRNFFGHVELTTDCNPLFEETSSREGLLENEAFHELRRFVRNAVEWSAKRIAATRNRKQDAGQKDFVAQPRRPSEVLQGLLDEQGAATKGGVSAEALAAAAAAASDYEEKIEKERAAALEYEEMLRLLASLGLSISVFGHEVKGAETSLSARLALLADAIAEVGDVTLRRRLERQQSQLQAASARLFDIGGYIAGLMSSTESRELRSLSVLGALNRFADQFSNYMRKQQVAFQIDVRPSTLRTTLMHASELDSVLLNFLTNSIKSMRQAKVAKRKVRMDARADGAHVVIGFEDNGLGIDEKSRARVFDAFYTTTMAADDDGIAGPGTGLGLRIVSDIAASYGGNAVVVDPSAGFTCRFEFRILAEAPSS